MKTSRPELLVLDGQGVVFNAPLRKFFDRLASELGLETPEIHRRWDSKLRDLAWSGQIPEDRELWRQLAGPRADTTELNAALEAQYQLGPAAEHLAAWSSRIPIWLLSNHRSHWLLPRIERFRLKPYFQKILVSDALGAMKPSPEAFSPLLQDQKNPARIIFVDDQMKNIRAAEELGIKTIFAHPENPWIRQIEEALAHL